MATFLKGRKARLGRDLVRYYNIDEAAWNAVEPDRDALRQELGLTSDAKLLLCLGRMVALKNPVRTVEIMCDIMHQNPHAIGVFAGDGDLLEKARQRARQLDMADRFRFLGWRHDTVRIMKCSDLLIFPRLEEPKEGLGLVIVEAQRAGLPVLTTFGISDDAIFTDRVVRLPLDSPLCNWTEQALVLVNNPRPSDADCRLALHNSPFSMAKSVKAILDLYPASVS